MITHLKFVSLPTTNQDEALTFWTQKVGFEVLTDQPFSESQRWIELGIDGSDTRLVLFNMDDEAPETGKPFHGAFACDDVDATYRQLSQRGVQFQSPPEKQHWGTFATMLDPDGNQFVLSSR